MSKSRIVFTKNQALNKTYLASHLLMLEDMSFLTAFQRIKKIAKNDGVAVMSYGYKQSSKNAPDKLISTNALELPSNKVLATLLGDKCSNQVIRLFFPVIGKKRSHWYMLKCTRNDDGKNIGTSCQFEFEHVSQKVMGQVLKEIETTTPFNKPLNILKVDI